MQRGQDTKLRSTNPLPGYNDAWGTQDQDSMRQNNVFPGMCFNIGRTKYSRLTQWNNIWGFMKNFVTPRAGYSRPISLREKLTHPGEGDWYRLLRVLNTSSLESFTQSSVTNYWLWALDGEILMFIREIFNFIVQRANVDMFSFTYNT